MPNYLISKGGEDKAPRTSDLHVVLIRAHQYHRRHPSNPVHHRQRLHLILQYYYDLTFAQIARLTNKSYNTVRNDILTEEILTRKSQKETDLLHDLYDYILYNAKYIP